MNSVLENYKIYTRIPKSVRRGLEIKSFYIFSDFPNMDGEDNMIFVTEDDKVYAFGRNKYGLLGLGHSEGVNYITEIKELSNQDLKEIHEGDDFMIGLNGKGRMFGWGMNDEYQLGLGRASKLNVCLKPQKIDLPINKNVEEICCGSYHTLALLSNGSIYGWGNNKFGQLGLGNPLKNTPQKLKITDKDYKFKYIYCHGWNSFAVTTNGLLFNFGKFEGVLGSSGNDWRSIGESSRYVPRNVSRIINLFNIEKICSNERNCYFLTNEGSVYFYDLNDKTPRMIRKLKSKITNIHNLPRMYSSVFGFDSESLIVLLNGNQFEFKRKYESFTIFYAKKYGITPKMVHISNESEKIDKCESIYFNSIEFEFCFQ